MSEMQHYIGVKEVKAKPMTKGEYNKYRGWEIPADEDPNDPGYLKDDGHGHIQWDPEEVFNRDFRLCNGMTFGLAIEALKKGLKVARKGWNDKNMFIVYMSPLYLPPYNTADTTRKVNDRTAKWIGEDTPLDSQGYFAMFTANKQWQPGWLAPQADMLAEDWMVAT